MPALRPPVKPNKKPRRNKPAGLSKCQQELALAVLEAFASPGLAVFLALTHTRVAGEETFRFERGTQVRIRRDQSARKTVTNCACLAVRTTTADGDLGIVFVSSS